MNETYKAQNTVVIDLEAVRLPDMTSLWKMNFATTYYMEIYRGSRGNNAKIYESEWFTNEPNHFFDKIVLTDAVLCLTDYSYPIEFKFINRNNFKMTNTEVCYLTTNFRDLKECSGGRTLGMLSPLGQHIADLKINKVKVEPI